MKDTRVLVIANDYTTLYNFRLELLKRMTGDGYDVTLALPYDDRNYALERNGVIQSTVLKQNIETMIAKLNDFVKNPN